MNDYLDALRDNQNAAPHQAVEEMNKFADQLTTYLGSPARCELLLGSLVNYGQEYQAILTFPPMNYAQTLWRVYVPLGDAELRFHPSGGKMEKTNDLHARLMKFLALPAVNETLQYIKGKAETFRQTGSVWPSAS